MINKRNSFSIIITLFLSIFFILGNSVGALAVSAPTITDISVGDIETLIGGVTLAETDVVIFVDGEFIGKAKVNSNDSQINNFTFSFINTDLNVGAHKATALAIDKNSLVLSAPSNEEGFNIVTALEPAITQEAAEEVSAVEKIGLPQITRDENITKESYNDNQNVIPGVEIIDEENNEPEAVGLINESQNQQSKLQLNLIVFILFLIAVIAWIFWVNRELIKERKQKNLEQDVNSDNDLGI